METSKSFLQRISVILILFFISTFVFGCAKNEQSEDVPKPTVIPTDIPTAPPAPDRVILSAAGNIDAARFSSAQVLIAELATGSGLEFEVRQEIFANEITPDVKIIVFLEQPNNLGSLAASAPGTQFVAIGNQNWTPPANGTIIKENNDHVAFLAGYLSALLAPNFRVGALQVSEDAQYNQAFNNGVFYYCGLCASVIYPLNTYPVTTQRPLNSPPTEWQAAFNEINASKVNVLFLPSSAASPELGTYLSGADVAIIGNQSPPEEFHTRWVATITSDGLFALGDIWDDLVLNNGGKVINASLSVSDINYAVLNDGLVWLSQGKMLLLNKVIDLLRDDQIYPYSVIQ